MPEAATVSRDNQTNGTGLLSEAEEFPGGVSFGRRIFPSGDAAKILNDTKNGGKARLLVAGVCYDYADKLGVFVDYYGGSWLNANFSNWDGSRAPVVLVDAQGNLSLSKEIKSVDEAERIAAKEKKQIADATLLANTKFMEKHRRELLVFSSRNASTLSENDFREGYWYVANAKEEISPKVAVAPQAAKLEALRRTSAEAAKAAQRLSENGLQLPEPIRRLIRQASELEKA